VTVAMAPDETRDTLAASTLAANTFAANTFAGNRAVGRIAVSVASLAGRSRRARVHEAGSLRVRFPRGEAGQLDAVIVNTAGGMAGGDRFDLAVTVGEGAGLTVTTAAAEKVYRSLGPATEIDVKLAIAAGGTLAWLPQETILFDRVNVRRTIEADLADGAGLLLAEAVLFGRAAMGEVLRQGHFFDRWRVRRAGRLVFAETVRLDGAVAQALAEPAAAGGAVAIATVLAVPGDDASVAAVRAMKHKVAGEVGVSAWNGIAVARLVARDGAALRRDLIAVLTALRGGPLPRLWLN
jgi:urease accessory protein